MSDIDPRKLATDALEKVNAALGDNYHNAETVTALARALLDALDELAARRLTMDKIYKAVTVSLAQPQTDTSLLVEIASLIEETK